MSKFFRHNNKNSFLWLPSAVPFFLFGFCYYLLSPFISLYFFKNNSLIMAANPYISLEYFNIYYVFDVFNILVFWLLGYFVALTLVSKSTSKLDLVSLWKVAPKVLFFALLLFLIILLFKTIALGGILFSGYLAYDIAILGPFATMVFLAAFLVNFFSKVASRFLFFLLFILSSLVLLGFGSRMFFVLAVITITLGYLSRNPKAFRSIKLYLFVFIVFVFILAVGVWRSSADFSFEMLMAIFLVEPLFTATSGSLYLENNSGRPYFNFPVDAMASVINFIPSVFFPNKLQLINELTFNELKESPFGASSIIVNMYSNFGYFYPIYFILIGMFYGFLRQRAYASIFYRTVYFSVLPLLMFHFFREGFITVFKVMFFNAFLFPAFIMFVLTVVFLKKTSSK